jgi:hypothetical protein
VGYYAALFVDKRKFYVAIAEIQNVFMALFDVETRWKYSPARLAPYACIGTALFAGLTVIGVIVIIAIKLSEALIERFFG